MNDRIGVIDYGGGNLRNVLNVLDHLGHPGRLVDGPADLEQVDRLIFPGVGSFGDCIACIDRDGLRESLLGWLREDRPFFGICLGYQVLFEESEESPGVRGLGFFPGKVCRFRPDDPGLKIPHMGWNQVRPVDPGAAVWAGTPDPLYLYFVHSFHPQPDEPSIVSSWTDYGGDFASSVSSGNVFAGQFHPERSQSAGLRLVKNFLDDRAATLSAPPASA